jgi:hypothetical protein
MPGSRPRTGSRVQRRLAAVAALAAATVLVPAVHADAAQLPGSNFEIDNDANLKLDNPALADWASVSEIRKPDSTSGAGDESFGQGAKEDTPAPTVVSGSIPPNKSDLKFFGVYQEGTTATGFLNLYWSRVQEPSGTTNMDFEFNKRQCTPNQTPADADCSANGITPIRTAGDLLVIYDLAQGGTRPVLSIREWSGTAWGTQTDLSASNKATGSINTAPIPAGESDGLGAHSPRTFGEAQLALSAIFKPGTCESFGSAYLKSRSSDSFTAALKDFVPPEAVSISNCGRAVVKKTDEGGALLAGASFTSSPANSAIPPSASLTEISSGVFCIDNLLIGTTYTIHESVTPPGYDTAPDQTVTPSAVGTCSTVTATTPPDLTFVNVAQRGALKIIKTAKHADTSGATSPNLVAGFTIRNSAGTVVGTVNTDAQGNVCVDNLPFGGYTVTESTVPTGYIGDTPKSATVSVKATCTAGTAATVTFVNTPLTDITVSVNSQIPGGTSSVITCGPATVTTPASGDGSLTRTDLPPGLYTCTILVDP